MQWDALRIHAEEHFLKICENVEAGVHPMLMEGIDKMGRFGESGEGRETGYPTNDPPAPGASRDKFLVLDLSELGLCELHLELFSDGTVSVAIVDCNRGEVVHQYSYKPTDDELGTGPWNP